MSARFAKQISPGIRRNCFAVNPCIVLSIWHMLKPILRMFCLPFRLVFNLQIQMAEWVKDWRYKLTSILRHIPIFIDTDYHLKALESIYFKSWWNFVSLLKLNWCMKFVANGVCSVCRKIKSLNIVLHSQQKWLLIIALKRLTYLWQTEMDRWGMII